MADITTYIKTAEQVLKEVYEPAWQNQLYVEPTVMLEKIKHEPLKSQKIVAAADIGLSGGFGFSSEDDDTPSAGRVMYERFVINPADMFVNIVISDKAVKLGGSGGAMFDLLDTEIKAAYAAAKWNVGRSMFGNGKGILANISAQSSGASKTVEVDDHKFLKEGLIVDIYNSGGSSVQTTGRIISVSRVKNSNSKYEITLEEAPSAQLQAGFITVQKSYNREITGIGAIFDDTIPTLYGVTKSEQPVIKPTVLDADHDICDEIITQALTDARDYKNSNVDMLMAGDAAFRSYINYLRTNNYRVEQTDGTLKGGFKGIKFLFGNREVEMYNEHFVPDNEIYGIETGKWKIEDTGWEFMQQRGGGIFNLMENKSTYRAALANYGNLICSNPGGCIRITNCNAVSTESTD